MSISATEPPARAAPAVLSWHGGFAAVVTAYGIGSVLGGATAGRPAEWLGRARALSAGLVAQTGCLVVLGTVRSLAAAVAAMAVFGALGMVGNVSEVTLLQERTPVGLLGRVSAANRTLSVAGAPLGALLGGATATAWGLNAPPLAAAVLFCCAAGVLIPAIVRRDGELSAR